MTTSEHAYNQELDYEAFLEELPALLSDHEGKVVVIHDRQCAGIFDNMIEAVQFGTEKYGSERFIAQEVVRDEPNVVSYSLAM